MSNEMNEDKDVCKQQIKMITNVNNISSSSIRNIFVFSCDTTFQKLRCYTTTRPHRTTPHHRKGLFVPEEERCLIRKHLKHN
jgi:hypothetical protein